MDVTTRREILEEIAPRLSGDDPDPKDKDNFALFVLQSESVEEFESLMALVPPGVLDGALRDRVIRDVIWNCHYIIDEAVTHDMRSGADVGNMAREFAEKLKRKPGFLRPWYREGLEKAKKETYRCSWAGTDLDIIEETLEAVLG